VRRDRQSGLRKTGSDCDGGSDLTFMEHRFAAMIFLNSPLLLATFLESDMMLVAIVLCVVFTADRITTGITKNPESKN
jgi:hypothetical protein